MSQGKIRFTVTNGLAKARTVVLEPWAGEYTLQPGKSFEVLAEGDLHLPLGFELLDDRVVISAFDSKGALLRIFQDGKELRSE